MATVHLHNLLRNPTSFNSQFSTRPRHSRYSNSIRCAESTQLSSSSDTTNRVVTVSNGNDSLEICRVLNGMWQTSGAWGRIDRDDAVEAMLRYADAGLSTFDMADHCIVCVSFGTAELLGQHCLTKFTFGSITKARAKRTVRHSLRPIECVLTEDNRRVVVKNGRDSIDICRVVNGMWQTSGGWGQIDRDNAVDAMLKYADAGLTTFDMADICTALEFQ